MALEFVTTFEYVGSAPQDYYFKHVDVFSSKTGELMACGVKFSGAGPGNVGFSSDSLVAYKTSKAWAERKTYSQVSLAKARIKEYAKKAKLDDSGAPKQSIALPKLSQGFWG